jgi:hypothetical protein
MQRAPGSEGLVCARGGEAGQICHTGSRCEARISSSTHGVEAGSSRYADAFHGTREGFFDERQHSKERFDG